MPVDPANPDKSLKIDAIFVYNDPRDWGLDISIIVDCLLSHQGIMGTLSAKNDDPSLPNRGYQQDGQPPLYFSNPDLWFAAEYALNRFGQGGFRAALEGVWNTVTGGHDKGVDLARTVIGKPSREMYLYAEKCLRAHREVLYGPAAQELPLQEVYMVGDNPGLPRSPPLCLPDLNTNMPQNPIFKEPTIIRARTRVDGTRHWSVAECTPVVSRHTSQLLLSMMSLTQ